MDSRPQKRPNLKPSHNKLQIVERKMLGTTFMYICHHAGDTSSPHPRNPDHLQSFHQKIDKTLTILVKGHTSSRKIWPIPMTWTSASPLQ
jgi:hypothetical protein